MPLATIEKAPAGGEQKEKLKPNTGKWWSRPIVLGILLFVAFNAFMSASEHFGWFENHNSAKYRDFWNNPASIKETVDGFNSYSKAPDVVLAGSSLVMYPFWAMDAELNPNLNEFVHYHQARTLELALEKATNQNHSVYSLASSGQMASDSLLLVGELLKGDRRPQWLVYGIAPRDIYDSNVKSPTATLPFQYLISASNFAQYASNLMPSWDDRFEFLTRSICYLYGHRWDFQQQVSRTIARAQKKKAATEAAQATGFNPTSEAALGRWGFSLKEYTGRYQGIAGADLSLQFNCLDKIASVSKERNIKLVVVNMPLPQRNRDLLPDGFYERYRGELQQHANKAGIKLIDLGTSTEFNDDDYWDSAHLNHVGGHKLLNHILPVISKPGAAKRN